MGEIVYILCALTSLLCAVLLGRAYFRAPNRLLLWSTLAFSLLAVNNILLVSDLVIWPAPSVDLTIPRAITHLAALLILIFGLIWESN
jgi:hypothetical protein